DRAEAGARADRRYRDASLVVAQESADEAEQRLGKPAMRRELTHQQEERNDDEIVMRQSRVGEILERVKERRDVASREINVTSGANDEHGDADRHTHDHQREHHAKDHEADPDATHECAPTLAAVAAALPPEGEQ